MNFEQQLRNLEYTYGNHDEAFLIALFSQVSDRYKVIINFNDEEHYLNIKNIEDNYYEWIDQDSYYRKILKPDKYSDGMIEVNLQPRYSKEHRHTKEAIRTGDCAGISSLWGCLSAIDEEGLNEAYVALNEWQFFNKYPPSLLVRCDDNMLYIFWCLEKFWKRSKNNISQMNHFLAFFGCKLACYSKVFHFEPMNHYKLKRRINMPGTLRRRKKDSLYFTHICYFDVDTSEILPIDIAIDSPLLEVKRYPIESFFIEFGYDEFGKTEYD